MTEELLNSNILVCVWVGHYWMHQPNSAHEPQPTRIYTTRPNVTYRTMNSLRNISLSMGLHTRRWYTSVAFSLRMQSAPDSTSLILRMLPSLKCQSHNQLNQPILQGLLMPVPPMNANLASLSMRWRLRPDM